MTEAHGYSDWRTPLLLAATAALGLILAACGSNVSPSVGATASGTPSQTVAPSQSTAASASSAASASEAATAGTIVKLSGFQFDPATLTIKVGTKVTFENMDGTTHTVTNGKDGTPDASPLFDMTVQSGASVVFKFTKAGTFDVTCKIHHSMNMTITVQ